MADIDLAATISSRDGVTVSQFSETSAPPLTTTDRFKVLNNGKMALRIETGGTPTTVTVEILKMVDDQPVTPRSVTIPAHSVMAFGGYPTDVYNDSESKLALSFSSVSGVTIEALCL